MNHHPEPVATEQEHPKQQYSGQSRLLLGVDGGGSKTEALVAALDEDSRVQVLGRGLGGPSSLRLAGKAGTR